MPARRLLLDRLRKTIADGLDPLIAEGARCALVDFPAHPNVGDSAIWLGEKTYLRRRGVDVAFTCDIRNYSKAPLEEALGDGTVLIHGGGNFGDLWPHHHSLRLRLLRDLPGRRIIQLPQTIHFQDDRALDETRRAIEDHGNFHMLVRDRVSQRIYGERFGRSCGLVPDMALYLGLQNRTAAPVADVFWLKRTDKESLGGTTADVIAGTIAQDWLEDGDGLRRCIEFLKDCKRRSLPVWRLERWLYDPFARARVRRGYRQLGQGRVVITERLHGHILCLLAGIPNVLIDNNYGKNMAVYEAWTSDWRGTRFVRTPAEAKAQADELLRDVGPSGALGD